MSPKQIRSLRDFLFQAEWWLPNEQTYIPVASMDQRYRFNCARLLLRRADHYKLNYDLEFSAFGSRISGEVASLDFDQAMDDLGEQPAEEFIRSTAIFKALTFDIPRVQATDFARISPELREAQQRQKHLSECPMAEDPELSRRMCECPPLRVLTEPVDKYFQDYNHDEPVHDTIPQTQEFKRLVCTRCSLREVPALAANFHSGQPATVFLQDNVICITPHYKGCSQLESELTRASNL